MKRLQSNVCALSNRGARVSSLDEANAAAGGGPGGPLKGATSPHSSRPACFMSLARLGWSTQQRSGSHVRDSDSGLEVIVSIGS